MRLSTGANNSIIETAFVNKTCSPQGEIWCGPCPRLQCHKIANSAVKKDWESFRAGNSSSLGLKLHSLRFKQQFVPLSTSQFLQIQNYWSETEFLWFQW